MTRPCPQCGSPCDEAHKFCPSCGFPVGKVQASPDDPLIGRTLPGGYLMLELVGIGGMGRVYRAEQTTLGRTVAVKIIHPHLVGEENAAARFITEARAASRLNHPNSVGIIDFGKSPDGQLYLVMEFLRGKDLARVTYEEGALPFRRIVDVLRQTLAALAEAHSENIIHRDLKPENIILEPVRSGGDFVKVVDFGLAKIRDTQAGQPSITSPGIVCGTPEYMSPEQARGDPLDARSDIYATGVLMFQLLTGRLPFEAESPTQVVLAHLTRPAPDPRNIAPDRQIPESLAQVCLKALSKDQKDRYQDADTMSAALADAMAAIEDRLSIRTPVGAMTPCPSCGALNLASQKFCGECGQATTSTQLSTIPARVTDVPQPPKVPRDGRKAPTAPAPKPAKKAPSPLPFIGRTDDLAWLETRRGEARSLAGARVVGDMGIGKTRLVREFLEVAGAAGDVVVQTGPDPAWAEVGCWALRRAIVQLAALPDSGGGARDWVAATPEARRGLADVFGHDASERSSLLTPDERRFAAAEALRWAFVRASERARGHRVVLAVDDLHHVDGASRNAFADALSDPPLVPALMIATYAAPFDPGWPSDVAPARVLTGLSTQEVAEALAKTLRPSGAQVGTGARTLVPLYLEQLQRFQREDSGEAPPGIADIIAVRIERLPADARRVLQAAAVWGDDADDAALTRMLGDQIDLIEALGELRRAGMVVVSPDGIRTSHPLMREVTLAMIPAAVRRELHAQAAVLCDERDLPLEVRALHETWGGTAFQALLLLERVSTLCGARGDHQGAIVALRRGLEVARRELFRGELDDPMRAVLIFSRKLGEALVRVGQLNDAEGVLREALDLAGPSGSDRAAVLGALAHVAHDRDRRQEARDYLREALDLATRSGAHELVTSLETLRRSIAV